MAQTLDTKRLAHLKMLIEKGEDVADLYTDEEIDRHMRAYYCDVCEQPKTECSCLPCGLIGLSMSQFATFMGVK